MCFLALETETALRNALANFLTTGKPFTGYEVAVAANADLPCTKAEASAFVRQCFNQGEMPGWASTQVRAKTGPVLYFKINKTSTAGKEVARLQKLLGD